MLQVIISPDLNTRLKHRAKELSIYTGEVIYLDDTNSSFEELQGYIYPSLFSEQAPFVHAKNILEEFSHQITKEVLSLLVKSPTIFLLEESVVSKDFVKMIEKEGGIVHHHKETKKSLEKPSIFLVTNAITAVSKKDRWLSYRQSLEDHSAEAIIGILYWKLKDMISRSRSDNLKLKRIYSNLINAHKTAWQKGFSLELAIEKVILTA